MLPHFAIRTFSVCGTYVNHERTGMYWDVLFELLATIAGSGNIYDHCNKHMTGCIVVHQPELLSFGMCFCY